LIQTNLFSVHDTTSHEGEMEPNSQTISGFLFRPLRGCIVSRPDASGRPGAARHSPNPQAQRAFQSRWLRRRGASFPELFARQPIRLSRGATVQKDRKCRVT
jgi:hypothetical protein